MKELTEKDIFRIMEFVYEKDERAKASDIESFKNEFDYDCFLTATKMIENAQELTDKDWQKIYNKYKHNNNIVHIILNSPNFVPPGIISDIVFNTKIVENSIKDTQQQDPIEIDILERALQHNIPNVTIDEIYNNMKDKLFKLPNQGIGIEILKKANKNVIARICDRILKSEFEYDTNAVSDPYKILMFVDKEYIKKLLKSNDVLHEQAKTSLINNYFLDPKNPEDAEIIETLFDDRPRFEGMTNFTDYTRKEHSQYFFDAFVSNLEHGLYNSSFVSDDVKNELVFLLKSNNIDHDIEAKLFDTVINYKLYNTFANKDTTHFLLVNTDNPKVFNRLNELPDAEILECIEGNPHLTEDVCLSIAEHFMDKYNKARIDDDLQYSKDKGWEANAFCSLSQKATLTDEQYKFILLNCNSFTNLSSMILSDKTPKYIIEALAECPSVPSLNNIKPKIRLLSQLVLEHNQGVVSDDIFDFMTHYIEKMGMAAVNEFADEYDNLFNNPYVSYTVISYLTKYNDKSNELYQYMSSLSSRSDSDSEKAFLSHGIKYFKEEFERQKGKRNKFDGEYYDQNDIVKKLRKMPIFYRFNLVPSSYASLYENIKIYQKLEEAYKSFDIDKGKQVKKLNEIHESQEFNL